MITIEVNKIQKKNVNYKTKEEGLLDLLGALIAPTVKKPSLSGKNNQFLVWNTSDSSNLSAILMLCTMYGLTVAGDGSANTNYSRATGYYKPGDVIAFGIDKRFDVIRLSLKEAYEKYGELSAYSIPEDMVAIEAAIAEFAKAKKSMSQKYPNRTLYEMNLLEGMEKESSNSCKCRKSSEKVDVVVTNDWIKIGTKFISKNAADTVIVSDKNTRTIVPGYYSSIF